MTLKAAFPAACVAAALAAAVPAPARAVEPAVVKLFVTARRPNYYQPWQLQPEESRSGSGVVIAGPGGGLRILTNAHVVTDHVYIEARRAGEAARAPAEVEFIAHDAELALLKVRDPAFFEGAGPVSLGELPRQRDKVLAYGFPEGGEDLSVTEGIVSRIEVAEYAHSGWELLAIQTDAALNPGNSGGPMVKDGKLVGVTFEVQEGAQNIGFAVPALFVRRFLDDAADGRYDGLPDLGLYWQTVVGETLRRRLGLGPRETGIRVAEVHYGASAWGVLEPGDVLLSIDGQPIEGDGTVAFRGGRGGSPGGRVRFTHLVHSRQAGEALRLGILRRGGRRTLTVRLARWQEGLVPALFERRPSYLVFAGLVLTPLTRNYIDHLGEDEVPTALRFYQEFGRRTPELEELVVLSRVLPHAVNRGYHDVGGVIVRKVNGRAIKSLRDAADAFKTPLGGDHVLEADPATGFGASYALDAASADAASAEILARYGIEKDRSDDLR